MTQATPEAKKLYTFGFRLSDYRELPNLSAGYARLRGMYLRVTTSSAAMQLPTLNLQLTTFLGVFLIFLRADYRPQEPVFPYRKTRALKVASPQTLLRNRPQFHLRNRVPLQ